MGHEFTGEVVEAGSDVSTVKIGDKVVSPFTVCWYATCYLIPAAVFLMADML